MTVVYRMLTIDVTLVFVQQASQAKLEAVNLLHLINEQKVRSRSQAGRYVIIK